VDAHIFTKQAEECLNKPLPPRKLMAAVFWDRKGVLMVEFMQQGTKITSNRRHGMLTSGIVLLHDNALLALKHCWSVSTGACLTALLIALILFRPTATCLFT
jgi:hypothetical protein